MTTDFQKTLAVLASVASVVVGVVTIASYLSGEDGMAPAPSSESQLTIVHARIVFLDHDSTYIIDYDNNLIEWNESITIMGLNV